MFLMTVERTQQSVAELEEATAEGRIELAAARAELQASTLLSQAFDACRISQKELAEALGVGESRVSQVLSGYSNLRLTTLARYLRALGYRLRLSAEPADASVPTLRPLRSSGRSRRDRPSVDVYMLPSGENGSSQTGLVFWPSGEPLSSAAFGQAQALGRMASGNATVHKVSYERRIEASR